MVVQPLASFPHPGPQRRRRYRRLGALLAGSLLPIMYSTGAFALCIDFNALATSLEDNDPGPASAIKDFRPPSVESGDTLTFNASLNFGANGGTTTVTVAASPNGVDDGRSISVPTGGSGSLQVNGTGNYTFNLDFAAAPGQTANITVSVTCAAGAAGGAGSSGSSASDSASGTDAGVQTGDAGRLGASPVEMPSVDDGTESSSFNEQQERLFFLEGELASNRGFLADAQIAIIDNDQEIDLISSATANAMSRLTKNFIEEHGDTNGNLTEADAEKLQEIIDNANARAEEQIGELERKNRNLVRDKRRYQEKIQSLKTQIRDLRTSIENRSSSRNPLEASHAYTPKLSFFSTQSFAAGGPSNLWTRLKITSLNGTLGRGGLAVHGQVGLVWPTANGGSVGSFLSLFRASTSSSTLGTSNTATGLGLGGYYKFPLSSRLTGGISATYERSSNSTNNGTGTGSYARDLATLDASVSTTRRLGLTTLSPSASLSYTYSNRHAYTDSTATVIPARIEQALVASGSLNGSRVFAVRSPKVRLMTLSGGLTVSANMSGSSTIAFSSGATVTNSAWSASVNGGASWLMSNGGTFNLGASIGGIGASVQSYSASLRYDLRF